MSGKETVAAAETNVRCADWKSTRLSKRLTGYLFLHLIVLSYSGWSSIEEHPKPKWKDIGAFSPVVAPPDRREFQEPAQINKHNDVVMS